MGFSWGGDLGCHFAARHPDCPGALVLLDPGYRDPPFDPRRALEDYRERNEQLARTTANVSVSPEVVAAVEHGIAQSLPSTTRPRLAATGVPVLLLAAADAPERDLARFAAEVPQADVRRVEGAGHDVLADGGAETVDAVGEWLRSR